MDAQGDKYTAGAGHVECEERHYLIQFGMFTGKRESEGQRMFLLQADVLLVQEVLQRL